MFEAIRQELLNHLFQRGIRVFLPAADRHAFGAVCVNTHVQRQHHGIGAVAFEPALYQLRLFYRGGTDHHAGCAGLQQGSDVLLIANAAANLYRYVNSR
ncbi:hypothetical protein D3C80_557780 [compost metagenome]